MPSSSRPQLKRHKLGEIYPVNSEKMNSATTLQEVERARGGERPVTRPTLRPRYTKQQVDQLQDRVTRRAIELAERVSASQTE
jgi:hypothetical protein